MARSYEYEGRQARLPEPLGQSEAFLDFQARLAAVAPVERPVLISGERGTGKELAAARLHFLSKRWEGPLVSLNCAALSPTLIESELFGHEPGAFTGATGRRQGRFEMADGGTLFLDELGLVPMAVQEKILRVTEYGTFERVGGTQSVRVDVRIVGATNADLAALVDEERFKADLLDRLSFDVLHVPPLRVRAGDVPLLARHFAARMAAELGMGEAPALSDAALAQLEAHPWPGNVRELKNVVERAVYRSGGQEIGGIGFEPFRSPWEAQELERDARAGLVEAATPTTPSPLDSAWQKGLPRVLQELEQRALDEALRLTRCQRDAARMLGMDYHPFRTLYRKVKTRHDRAR
jgi:psp operon transcriptional activator